MEEVLLCEHPAVSLRYLNHCAGVLGDCIGPGWCWWYRKYAPGNTVLEELERDAREAKKGLWAAPVPLTPWGMTETTQVGFLGNLSPVLDTSPGVA